MRDAAVEEITVAVPSAVASDVKSCIGSEFSDGGVSYVTFDAVKDTGSALGLAAEKMDNAPCVVHVADGLLAQPLAPLTHPMDDGSADMLLLLHHGANRADQLGHAARRLLGIAAFEPATNTLGVAGVCFFGLGALRRACARTELAGGQGDFIAMADRLVTAGGRTEAQLVRGWRRYAGQVNDLLDLNRATLQLLVTDHDHHHGDGANRIEGPVSIDATAEVTSSVIVGPVVIGARARVTNAYIGPYTSVGAGARIDGAEIEQSIISCDASIRHIEGRLASSVIGPRARIHRDFSMPRSIRVQISEDAEVSLP
jgi:glucose-1-phosphate thymidylyltransferase